MSPFVQKHLCRLMLNQLFNQGELHLMEMFFAPDAVHHELESPDGDGSECTTTMLKSYIHLYRKGFPDLRFTILDQICEEDRVVTRWRVEGTQTGMLMGINASGRPMKVEGIRIDRFEEGQIVETWNEWDVLGMLDQIGATPTLNRCPKPMFALVLKHTAAQIRSTPSGAKRERRAASKLPRGWTPLRSRR